MIYILIAFGMYFGTIFMWFYAVPYMIDYVEDVITHFRRKHHQ